MGPVLTAILGGGGPIGKAIEVAVDRLIPDKHLSERLNAEIQAEIARTDMQGQLAQIDLNKIDAASTKWFQASARPAFMWVGAVGFAVQFVIIPIVDYAARMTGYTPPPPLFLDPVLWQVAGALLGIQFAARTAEKIKGVAS